VSEVPVTEDDKPGIEVIVEDEARLPAAVAFLIQARQSILANQGETSEITETLGSVLGLAWRPTFGDGLLPRTSLSRTEQAELWKRLDAALDDEPPLGPRSHWPGSFRLFVTEGLVLSVRLSRHATTVAAEVSHPISDRQRDRVVRQPAWNGSAAPAVQRRTGKDVILTVVGPELERDDDRFSVITGSLRDTAAHVLRTIS
jgi:hypothetical protein